MATIAEIRAQYPQYEDMSDGQLADALYQKHYSDMPRADFNRKVGLSAPAPANLKPGTREYADWARSEAMSGKSLPQVSATPQEWTPPTAKSTYEQSLANIRKTYYPELTDEQWQKAMDAKGFLGESMTNLKPHESMGLLNDGLTMGLSDEARGAAGAVSALFSGKDPGKAFQDYQQFEQARREYGAEQSGALGTAAQIGGAVLAGRPDQAAMSAASKLPAWVKGGLDAAKQGAVYGFASTEGDLKDRAAGALTGGVFGGTVGAAVPFVAGKVGDKITSSAQRKVTDAAIKGAPDAATLKSAGAALFDASTGGNAPAVASTAYDRFMANVQASLAKIRPNAANDPQAMGLLQHLESLAQAAKTPGTIVDFKDLHLARQLAQKVGQSSSGRDAAIGNIVANKIDEFINGLKPADILGGADPSKAAGDLMKGISTWSRARKVGLIEAAIQNADTYKSGMENGLKLSFLKLMRSPDFAKFSEAEKAAIREVAKGTTPQNIAELFGKLGFSFSGSAAHNIIGGSVGTGALATALTPVLGPFAVPVALGTTTAAGAAGRHVAEKIATKGADRVAQIVATPNIPQVAPANMQGLERALQSLIRGAQPLLSK